MLCLLGAAMLVAASTAAASNLARGFGTGGVVKLRGLVKNPSELAIGPGGGIFILGWDGCGGSCDPHLVVSKLSHDGTLNRRYGVAGKAATTLKPGPQAVFAVDRRGRALVMTREGHEAPASLVRLDPGGRPDRSFGVDGVATTEVYGGFPGLGLGLAAGGGFYTFAFWQKSVFVPGGPEHQTTAVIAVTRFGADGNIDHGYGSDGELKRGFRGVAGIGAVAERHSDGVIVFGTTCCRKRRLPTAARFTGRGRIDRRFGRWQGFGGIRRVVNYYTTDAVARRNGKVDLYGNAIIRTGKGTRGRAGFAVRLRRDGRPFGRFGPRRGIRLAAWPIKEAVIDGRGRTVALAHGIGPSRESGVFRLRPGGAPDRTFASGGPATFPFSLGFPNLSLGLSRNRPVVFDEAPGECTVRGPSVCTLAKPVLVAFRSGPHGRRASG